MLVVVAQISYGQTLSKQVTDYIAIQDSIVVIKNVTLIDGSGGKVKGWDGMGEAVSFEAEPQSVGAKHFLE